MEIEHVLRIKNRLGEGPLWHPGEQALYWVDIMDNCFYRLYPASDEPEHADDDVLDVDEHERFDVGVAVGCLAFREGGGLVLATGNGLAFWEAGALEPIADPEADRPETRFNDGRVDPRGRLWAGTIGGGEPTCALYRLDPDLSLHTMETGITVSNGIGWSPDGKTMYYTDSAPRMIYAYDYDPATGGIENRRPFAHTPDEPGVPDGLAVDGEGFVWSARWDGWKVTRYDPAGRVERVIEMPVQRPTSCAFGGPGLDELYVTSARVGFGAAELERQPLAGDLFRLRVGVKGMVEHRFGESPSTLVMPAEQV